MAYPPSSVAGTDASPPSSLPNGVRAPPTITDPINPVLHSPGRPANACPLCGGSAVTHVRPVRPLMQTIGLRGAISWESSAPVDRALEHRVRTAPGRSVTGTGLPHGLVPLPGLLGLDHVGLAVHTTWTRRSRSTRRSSACGSSIGRTTSSRAYARPCWWPTTGPVRSPRFSSWPRCPSPGQTRTPRSDASSNAGDLVCTIWPIGSPTLQRHLQFCRGTVCGCSMMHRGPVPGDR